MVKLVDTLDSKSSGSDVVAVRVRPQVPPLFILKPIVPLIHSFFTTSFLHVKNRALSVAVFYSRIFRSYFAVVVKSRSQKEQSQEAQQRELFFLMLQKGKKQQQQD